MEETSSGAHLLAACGHRAALADAGLVPGLPEVAGDVDEEVGTAGGHVALDGDRSGDAQ
jgi:hypothetical protein